MSAVETDETGRTRYRSDEREDESARARLDDATTDAITHSTPSMSFPDDAMRKAIYPPASGSRPSWEHRFDEWARACAAVLNARRTIWDTENEHSAWRSEPSDSPTVSQLMFTEQAYAHDGARTHHLAALSEKMSLAGLFNVCYQRVNHDSRGVDRNGDYDLSPLARKEVYHAQVTHSRTNDTLTRTPLRAGGLADALYDAVFSDVLTWATSVFAAVAAQVDGGAAVVVTSDVSALVERVAVHITCRAVCKPCGSHTDPLASSALEQMSAQYVEAELVACEDAPDPPAEAIALLPTGADPRWGAAATRVHADMVDVGRLAELANATTAADIADVLRRGLVELRRIGEAPPPELRSARSWRKCGYRTLRHIVDAQDERLRLNLAVAWIESSSRYVLDACCEAQKRMGAWRPMATPFLDTLTLQSATVGDFPRLQHTAQRNHYRLAPCLRGEGRVRTGLSPTNECAVRFVSVVWDLVARHGEMRAGHLNAGVVCDVSLHCSTQSMLVHQLLHERIMKEGLFVGPTLHATTDEIMESEGQFASEVADASHAVCRQTISELFEPMQLTDDAAMEAVTGEIGLRLRPLLHKPPDEAEVRKLRLSIREKEASLTRAIATATATTTARASIAVDRRSLDRLLRMHPAFVFDAYALAATAVAQLRHRMRIPSVSPIHPVISGLVRSSLVREWTPTAGPLVLDEKALDDLPADTRHWLMSVADERPTDGRRRAGYALCTRRHDKGKRAQIVLMDPHALMRLVVHCALNRPEE